MEAGGKMSESGGWSGKVLRVDLSTGKIWSEDTLEKYRLYLGGTGIGYKVLWDEVPNGVRAWDPENRIVFACGPLAGTSALCSGRTAVTSLWPPHKDEWVASGHMGGYFASEMKYAGWDAIIIQGCSPKPVWLYIKDGDVQIKDARRLWGIGIYRTHAEICDEMGAAAQVAAIGPAGENLVRMSCIITGNSHSAGGVGSVMGSKKLKAIGVLGSRSVKIKADPAEWKKLIDYALSLAGANNQWVVPSTPQPWSEWHNPRSRWTADPQRYWGAADPPIPTGTCDPHDRNSIGYRTFKAIYDFGEVAQDYTVRMDGCHACPIRCFPVMRVPSANRYGAPAEASNTCGGWWAGTRVVHPRFNTYEYLESAVVGKFFADDFGLWNNYNLMPGTFQFAYDHGILKAALSPEEYQRIPWDLYESNSPEFVKDFCRRVSFKIGEFGRVMGEGTDYALEQWDFPPEYYLDGQGVRYFKHGHTRHHEWSGAQVGLLINMQYNRDPQCHSHSNFLSSGLPSKQLKEIAAERFGSPDAVDAGTNFTRMNAAKARFAKFSVLRKELHDSLPLCNWMFPWLASPLKERGYRGDSGLEAKFYSAVTGDHKNEQQLDLDAERIFNLHRCLTMRQMKTRNLREAHDLLPPWVFNDPNGKEPYTPGARAVEREDMETARDMFYEECGWDKKKGAPTKKTLKRLGLEDVALGLKKAGLGD